MMDRPTLLLADDDPTIITALTPFLERAGFHVLTAINGKDALEKAQSHRPDLIVLDTLMPRMDGREVLRRLRHDGLQTSTILLTQVGDAHERALALDGSIIHSFGTFSNFSSPIFPFVWSPDGSQVAFANLRRLYVVPRVSQLDVLADTFGIPPDTREVYVADDTYITPSYMDIQFSHDSKYLLMQAYEGFTHFVVVSLESGQSTPLPIPHMDPFVWDDNYVGNPSFFSWRQ